MLGTVTNTLVTLVTLALVSSIALVATQDDIYIPTIEDVIGFSDSLLKKQSKYIVPKMTPGPFNVTIYVSLLAVGEIDEIEEKVSTVMQLYYNWKDEFIRWNDTDTQIGGIVLGWADVWKPILRVSNPHTDDITRVTDYSYDTIYYQPSGVAFYDEMRTTRTTCDLDMTYYPFDVQSCDIEMFIAGNAWHFFYLDVSVAKGFDISDANHGSWKLISQSITSSFGKFKIQLIFERRPLFLLLNILLPIIVLALLTPIVFVLPKKSGERVGFSITMLLAISVYMTIVSDHLPQNSQPMPLVSIMMFIWYIMDALIVFVVIINTKIHTMKESKPVSIISQKFVILTRKLMCQHDRRKNCDETTEETEKCINIENGNGKEEADGNKESADDANDIGRSTKITWQDLSHAVDKWCFLISYLLKVAVPIVFFSIAKAQSYSYVADESE